MIFVLGVAWPNVRCVLALKCGIVLLIGASWLNVTSWCVLAECVVVLQTATSWLMLGCSPYTSSP